MPKMINGKLWIALSGRTLRISVGAKQETIVRKGFRPAFYFRNGKRYDTKNNGKLSKFAQFPSHPR